MRAKLFFDYVELRGNGRPVRATAVPVRLTTIRRVPKRLPYTTMRGHDHEAEGHDHEGHDHATHDHEGHDHEGHSHEAESHDGHNHEAEEHDHSGEEAAHAEAASGEISLPAAKAAAAGVEVQTVSAGPFRDVIVASGRVMPAPGDETAVVASVIGRCILLAAAGRGCAGSQGRVDVHHLVGAHTGGAMPSSAPV